jgi:hypothetical protein
VGLSSFPSAPPCRDATLLGCIERGILLAVLAGILATSLLVVRNQILPEQRPWTFALALLPWYVAFAGAVVLPVAVLAWAVGRWKPSATGLLLRLLALVLAGVVMLQNTDWLVRGLTSPEGPSRHRYLLPTALVLGLLSLGATVVLPFRRRLPSRALTFGSLVAFTVACWPPPARPAPRAPAGSARPGGPSALRSPLLLYGLDGADWRYVEPLMARGELPNLAALRARGAWGPLESSRPTSSPIIWTTIATGQPLELHGVTGFTVRQLRGVDDALPNPLRRIRGLGFRRLESFLEQQKKIYEAPVPSTARQLPAFWNIASRFGSPTAVVNWWATWPAEPVLGAIVSERMYFWRFAAKDQWTPTARLVYPDELGGLLSGKVMRPDEVTHEQARPFMDVSADEFRALMDAGYDGHVRTEFKYLYSMHETNRRIAPELLAWGRKTFGAPPDILLLERIVDIACHDALHFSELVEDHLGASPEDLRRFSRLVSEAYKRADRALGELVSSLPEANVIVVSDHGFGLEDGDSTQAPSYDHRSAPAGIFIAAGPAFRPGRVDGLGILDLLPLLLYLKGFPQADDLPGQARLEVFRDGFRKNERLERIATYGTRQGTGAWSGPPAMDEEILERLRALGYVQ